LNLSQSSSSDFRYCRRNTDNDNPRSSAVIFHRTGKCRFDL
jgi:hypothetical protein